MMEDDRCESKIILMELQSNGILRTLDGISRARINEYIDHKALYKEAPAVPICSQCSAMEKGDTLKQTTGNAQKE